MTSPDDPDIWNGARVASPADEMLRLACLGFEGWHPGLAERARAIISADTPHQDQIRDLLRSHGAA